MIYEGSHRLGDLFSSRREKGKAGLPVLSVTMNDGLVNREDLERKQESSLSPEEHLLVREGDIAYNMMRMWQGAFGLATNAGMVSPAYVVLVSNASVAPLFASYLFKTNRVLHLFWAYSHGLTEDRLRLYFDDFSKIPVTIPDLQEQGKIGEILATWDKALKVAKRLLENSRQQKLALMQNLLTGNKRITDFNGPWQVRYLGDLFSERVETGFISLPLLSITREAGVIPREDVSEKDVSSGDKSNYRRICPGDIGYNTMRMWQGISALSNLEGIVSPAYTIVTPNDQIQGRFAAHLFKHLPMVFQFYRYSQGLVSDTWNLSYRDFSSIKVKIPSVPEQKAIADILDGAENSVQIVEGLILRLENEKRALMQQLLTGKRRVHLPASEAARA